MNPLLFWKKAPFARMLLPFLSGIITQWHFQFSFNTPLIIFCFGLLLLPLFFLLPAFQRFRLSFVEGAIICICLFSMGCMLVELRQAGVKKYANQIDRHSGDYMLVLQEPLVEKNKSWKARARMKVTGYRKEKSGGEIIVYFKKDSLPPVLGYGSRILVKNKPQPVRNTGNPGGFDYRRYCFFQGITHQVFLREIDYEILPGLEQGSFRNFLFVSRAWVVHTIRRFIPGEKEQGLAEALLIGYKDDLDKNLVQAYANTGVIHVIAISGLHLGLIYWILLWLTRPLKKRKWVSLLVILSGLWLFSLLCGAQASVLRSALMFSCIALGERLDRKASIFNSLAISAFILLCYQPLWAWDIGFQLSYAAVLSLAIFMRPVYNLIYVKSKLPDMLWKLNAVTISAQILTLPISLYHFDQFPNFFLITNLVAVPLSSFVLIGEILVCLLFFIPAMAGVLGQFLSWCIRIMNGFIEYVDTIPFATLSGIHLSVAQLCLLYFLFGLMAAWLSFRNRTARSAALAVFAVFLWLRLNSFVQASSQQKLIVYNIPGHCAVDILQGRKLTSLLDPGLASNRQLINFHLRSSRTMHRVRTTIRQGKHAIIRLNAWNFVFLDSLSFAMPLRGAAIDLLVISGKPALSPDKIAEARPAMVVFDASVNRALLARWKKELHKLKIPWHDVSLDGAFVMNLK